MAEALEALSRDALLLPMEERLVLAQQLLESVEEEPASEAEAAWEAEIIQRIARFDAGGLSAIPAAEVFARLRKIAPGK